MDIKSLDELREPDERTLRFQPLGLGGRMRPEDAAVFQQQVISHAELVADVPEPVRSGFEQLRTIYAYGVLCYDFFTVAYDQAQLALEFALRERFVEFYGGIVPLSDGSGNLQEVPAATFEQVHNAIRRIRQPRLRVRRTGKVISFNGMLDSLMRWARAEGLLRGQRNRALEPVLMRLRNHVAHGAGYHLLMPTDAARAISDVAEIINHLWGAPTPGGRLYPAPIRRDIQIVGWSSHGDVMAGQVGLSEGEPADEPATAASEQLEAGLPGKSQPDEWTWVLVRAVPHDEGLMRFDSLFEVTTYSAEMLWGPGTAEAGMTWLEERQPQADEVQILDRPFLIQHQQQRLYLPRRPEVATGLQDDDRQGVWYFVRADDPTDAFGHVRRVVAGDSFCSRRGPCQRCAVDTVGTGNWDAVAALLEKEGVNLAPRAVPDARVSNGMRWPRYNRNPRQRELDGSYRVESSRSQWTGRAQDHLTVPRWLSFAVVWLSCRSTPCSGQSL